MATANTVKTTSSFHFSIMKSVSDMVESIQKRRLYRRTLRELSALSNHDLNDLGIGRGEIRAVAYDAIYGN